MNFNKTTIIGIKGEKNSGKDVVASMLSYIITVGITKADFKKWETLNNKNLNKDNDHVIHFADKIKDNLSQIFNIKRDYFDDHKYKDELYWLMDINSFLKKENINKHYKIIELNDLEKYSLNVHIITNKNCIAIKLRTLMQYYGTEIVRDKLYDLAWINICINNAIYIRNYIGFSIIADVRFDNESKAITDILGKIIYIKRDSAKQNIDNHISENIKISDSDYIIENNDTLLKLFYKVIEFVRLYCV